MPDAKPILTLATLGAVVAILAVAGPFAAWLFGLFESAADARAAELRNARRDAWAAYAIADVKATMYENRVYDCAKERSRGALTPAEVAICEQFVRNFDTANEARKRAYAEAISFGKEKGSP